MGFKCGIVGLPNVGKSTLFNALTETAAAQAANYPFCTIEPNIGNVAVPDARLEKLAGIANSKKIIATQLAFVAGLKLAHADPNLALAASLVYNLWFVGASMLIGGVLWLRPLRRPEPAGN